MGAILSKKTRDKAEELDRINKEIDALEGVQRRHALVERRIQSGFLFYGTILFVIALAFGVAYFYSEPTVLTGSVAFLLVAVAPGSLYTLYRFIKSIRRGRFERLAVQIRELSEKKQEILEEVAEKETYNKAKEIMERYGRPHKIDSSVPFTASHEQVSRSSSTPLNLNLISAPVKNQLQKQTLYKYQSNQQADSENAPAEKSMESLRRRASAASASLQNAVGTVRKHSDVTRIREALQAAKTIFIDTQSAVRPLFNPDRTLLERITDLFIGDGPDSRFALICQNCYAHNGMALPEEFAFITFRCAYCSHLNPARSSSPLNTGITSEIDATSDSVSDLNDKELDSQLGETVSSSATSEKLRPDVSDLTSAKFSDSETFEKIDADSD